MAEETKQERGLEYWMERVIQEADKARRGFEADPVHDLRVAIRRCRSMGDGFRMLDPNPTWQKMRKAGKAVFSALGELRDVQVQMEWLDKLSQPGDPVHNKLMAYFQHREAELKQAASIALANFDTAQWLQWAKELGEAAARIPIGGDIFQVIALERWNDARELHRVAMRNRSKVALHQVRIGIKKFRYIVENFLPALHEAWIRDMKGIQDLLGEIHDLDVLTETALRIRAYDDLAQRTRWRSAITAERSKRLDKYRSRMIGRESLWMIWRSGLPSGEALRKAILKKFELWSSLRDPDRLHTEAVLELSLQLFDFYVAERLLKAAEIQGVTQRDLLTVAVLGHEAGRLKSGSHHKKVVKIFDQLDVPPGWQPFHLHLAGMIARYHRGAPPNEGQKKYAGLRKAARGVVDRLAGVIRLADSIERQRDLAAREVNIARNNGNILITAAGVHDRTRQAERIAAARHLLESTCGVPILVRPA
ncbi:MAG TPA: CHAD domain-containing protein [Terriglobales bacterium]|nr:CHAD domain-containing protein [Terriglobales bacterium]